MSKLNSFSKFFTFFVGTVIIVLFWVTSASGQVQLTENSKLAINGIGPIRLGMTVDEASRAAGVKLVFVMNGPDAYSCSYFKPQGELKDIAFMVAKGRIARIDIRDKRITTIRGARIGDTLDRIISLYPGQIQIIKAPLTARPEGNPKNLTFVPKDDADKNYRIIFEKVNNRVYRFRSGKLPEIEYIEGCL
ncbi:hypothetical protein IQ270_27845 [Microcoleus sp. LEGE 07076]|uniref:hypothetical protein n=1 Tax=Microcoleus sp. LEGE 07076 TaxID=915322 RepID=UPI0018812B35|nr:hypothetical protein [Microcoleus sp. LEGE 07076]MBE9188342.1 hypothetical protein [Microcoleus sp. LEGE 07076]